MKTVPPYQSWSTRTWIQFSGFSIFTISMLVAFVVGLVALISTQNSFYFAFVSMGVFGIPLSGLYWMTHITYVAKNRAIVLEDRNGEYFDTLQTPGIYFHPLATEKVVDGFFPGKIISTSSTPIPSVYKFDNDDEYVCYSVVTTIQVADFEKYAFHQDRIRAFHTAIQETLEESKTEYIQCLTKKHIEEVVQLDYLNKKLAPIGIMAKKFVITEIWVNLDKLLYRTKNVKFEK
jgi:hypothetical protein